MLGTKTKPNTDKVSAPGLNGVKDSTDTCVISSGTVIEGKFSSTENVRLDGFVKGEFKCNQRLVMGESGRIEGTVRTKDAVIMGKVEGEIYVENSLHIKGAGQIKGIIEAKYMTVDEGARYVGECKVGA